MKFRKTDGLTAAMFFAIIAFCTIANAYEEELFNEDNFGMEFFRASNHIETGEFESVAIKVVYSATDDDAQIIISGGSDNPIRKIKVFGPGYRLYLFSWFNDRKRIGHADFKFDTPEPSMEKLMKAYPEGNYRFIARTVNNKILFGNVELSHELLNAPNITYPEKEASDIPVNNLVATWEQVYGAEAIRLEIEDEEEEVALKVDLPGDATSFMVPDNWLKPGTEYVLDIKATGENGNQTVTDLHFTTAE